MSAVFITMKSGMMIASSGTIWMTSIVTMKKFRPRKLKRATATAARKPTTRPSSTEPMVISRVFCRPGRNAGSSKMVL